jgi:hypothetical protein
VSTSGKDGSERSVALPQTFIEHYLAYRDSKLPRVGAIVTSPLVLPDGSVLANQGLDRRLKILFWIDPALMAQMPKLEECDNRAVAQAMEFLIHDWLCDVAADFQGKCVLVAFALTILERVLLPERPALFVTAGQRGGGKTTAVIS